MRPVSDSFASLVTILVFVIDPFANIPLALSLLSGVPAERRLKIIARECGIAALTLLTFLLFGRQLLQLFGLSDASVDISGGVVLLLIAVRMIFKDHSAIFGDTPDGEPLIVPLAIPLIAGPGAIGTVLLLGTRADASVPKIAAAILVAVGLTLCVLAFAQRIAAKLGQHMLSAIERLMGIVLAAMAVEMLLRGITAYVAQLSR
jgi:MarC family membrane protein